MAARAQIGVLLPPEARDALDRLARAEGAAVSTVAAEALCRAVGVDPPPRADRRYARDVVPRLARLALELGGVTVDGAAAELGVSREVAWKNLDRGRKAGALTARRRGRRDRVLVYRATDLGRRMAESI